MSPCVHNLNVASLIYIKGNWGATRENEKVRKREGLIFEHTHNERVAKGVDRGVSDSTILPS